MRYLGIGPNLMPPAVVFTEPRTSPRAADLAAVHEQVTLVRTAIAQPSGSGVIPDLIGLNAREAIRVLARIGVTPHISGDGIVVQQDPPPGTPADPGTGCSLALGRPVSPGSGSDQRQ